MSFFGLLFNTGKHTGMPIYPKGNDVGTGFRDWASSEIKESVRRRYDLGKFFFSVSAVTIGTLLTLLKIVSGKFTVTILIGFLMLTISVLLAITLVLPEAWKLGGKSNLVQKHREFIAKIQRLVFGWLFFWLLGIGVSFCGII